MIRAVDLFCGAGGFTHGLFDAGIDVALGVDIEPTVRHAYESNNRPARFMLADVSEIAGDAIRAAWGGARVTLPAGSPPCQEFSRANSRRDPESPRASLAAQFARLVEESRPDYVAAENVPGAANSTAYATLIAVLERLGYQVTLSTHDAADYGVPQRRIRLLLLAARDWPVTMLSPAEVGACGGRTVRDAIADLPPLEAGEADPDDPLHRAAALSPLTLERARASRPGGTWRDMPEHLWPPRARRGVLCYRDAYGRMEWDRPAPTITTLIHPGCGRYFHPEQDRCVTLRELAMLQGFPRRYSFWPDAGHHVEAVARMIGNAVPPPLARAIGLSVIAHARVTGRLEAIA